MVCGGLYFRLSRFISIIEEIIYLFGTHRRKGAGGVRGATHVTDGDRRRPLRGAWRWFVGLKGRLNPYGQKTTPALLARRDLWHAERWSTTSGPLVIALRAFTLFFLPFLRATGRVVPGAPASFVRRDSIDPFKPTNHLQAPRSGRLLFAYDAAARGDCCESRDSEVMGGRE